MTLAEWYAEGARLARVDRHYQGGARRTDLEVLRGLGLSSPSDPKLLLALAATPAETVARWLSHCEAVQVTAVRGYRRAA